MDHYQFLGIKRTASLTEIDAAARSALSLNDGDVEQSKRIMDAWSVVGNRETRIEYDFRLSAHFSTMEPCPRFQLEAAAERALKEQRDSGERQVLGSPWSEPASNESLREGPASEPGDGSPPIPQGESTDLRDENWPAAEPLNTSPSFDPEQLTWWHEFLGNEERIGLGFNLLRLLVIVGITAAALGIVGNIAISPQTLAPLLIIMLCWSVLIKFIAYQWPRAASRRKVKQKVFGISGAVLSNGWNRFSKENVAKGVIGERRTALALESLLSIPGTRIFHGLRFPGSKVADIDHAVVNGDRVVYIDSKFWKPGEYRWLEADKLGYVRGRRVDRRTIHMDHVQRHPATAKVASEVTCLVLIHPNAAGFITFTPGAHVSSTGIHAADVQQGVDMIGHWLLQGRKSGLVDRYVMARMIASLK